MPRAWGSVQCSANNANGRGKCRSTGRTQDEDGRWWCTRHWHLRVIAAGKNPLPPQCSYCTRFSGHQIKVDGSVLPVCNRHFREAQRLVDAWPDRGG